MDAVLLPSKAEGRRQPSRPARQIEETNCPAARLHFGDAFQWLERAYQKNAPNAWSFARHIEQHCCSIVQIEVGMTAIEKQRPVASPFTAESMSAGIARRI